jgi:hypothetical protein
MERRLKGTQEKSEDDLKSMEDDKKRLKGTQEK